MNSKLTEKQLVQRSKFLSLVLRHRPEDLGITLDKNGWTSVDTLIKQLSHEKPVVIDRETLDEIVAKNNKKRFEFSEDGTKIRACQGHSVKVDLDLKEVIPPEFLYHGTQTNFVKYIYKDGLSKMKRNHVHLSFDRETAEKVAKRRGENFAIVIIASQKMHSDGFKFYQSTNGVWLTDNVPAKYIHQMEWKNAIRTAN